MKKWSDYKGEDAIDLLADIIEPLGTIFADPNIRKLAEDKKTKRITLVREALKSHKADVLAIMARIADMPVEEYTETVNAFTLPIELLSIVNDPSLTSLFTSQSHIADSSVTFGSAMGNTEAEKN